MTKQALKDEAEETMREAFDLFDKDGSGTISVQEFASMTRAMGLNPTDQEIEDFVLKDLDKDKNGHLDFKEFKKFYKGYTSKHNDKTEIQKAFQMFDKDGNGFIDAKELRQILATVGKDMTDEEIDEMIGSADTDSDGKINYIEFTDFMLGTKP